MTTEDLTLLLEVRSSVYGLLSSLYLEPVSAELLTAMTAPAFVAEWPLGRGSNDLETGLARLESALPNVTVESLRAEFWRLFGGLGPAEAPPWQSVYLDPEKVPFGEETLKIRSLFTRFGLEYAETGRYPEDHIGLELQFLAQLSARAATLVASGDQAGARQLHEGAQICLDAHLLRWVERFVSRVEAAAGSGFYGAIARITLGTLRADRAWLQG